MDSNDFFYTEDFDLTDEQIAITQETYLKFAGNYVFNFERIDGALENTRPVTLDPFIAHYKKFKLTQPVLFAGCGSCRDLEFASQQGIATIGLDISQPMLNIARSVGIESPLEIMDILNISYEKNSFDGIFCETALSHIKKSDLPKVIKNFLGILRPRGIALIGFRLGTGKVYFTDDSTGGVRYNTSVTKKEIKKMIAEEGLKILDTNIGEHQIKNRPPSYILIIQKPA